MKAMYKIHQGFEHLSHLSLDQGQSSPTTLRRDRPLLDAHNSKIINEQLHQIDDTSTKKYPHNKYYGFKDAESSGRKYLKQMLNIYEESSNKANKNIKYKMIQPINQQNQTKKNQSRESQSSQQKQNIQNENKGRRQTNDKYTKIQKLNNFLKPNKSNRCSQVRAQKKGKKISANLSTIQSKCKSAHHYSKPVTANSLVHSSRYNEKNDVLIGYQQNQQLKYYKKICLSLRKKNEQLTKKLQNCKQDNLKSIHELQNKVDKIGQKYIQIKDNADNNKTAQIMENLKVIKGKLDKGKVKKNKDAHRFYQFFKQSLGILYKNDKNRGISNISALEIQIIWKQILQFLIMKDFKLQ